MLAMSFIVFLNMFWKLISANSKSRERKNNKNVSFKKKEKLIIKTKNCSNRININNIK